MKKIDDLFLKPGFSESYFNQLSLDTKFKKRFRELSGLDFLSTLIVNATHSVISYNILASSIAEDTGKLVSKQALHKSMKKKRF